MEATDDDSERGDERRRGRRGHARPADELSGRPRAAQRHGPVAPLRFDARGRRRPRVHVDLDLPECDTNCDSQRRKLQLRAEDLVRRHGDGDARHTGRSRLPGHVPPVHGDAPRYAVPDVGHVQLLRLDGEVVVNELLRLGAAQPGRHHCRFLHGALCGHHQSADDCHFRSLERGQRDYASGHERH